MKTQKLFRKIIFVLMVIISINIVFMSQVQAENAKNLWDKMKGNIDSFENVGSQGGLSNVNEITGNFVGIGQLLTFVGGGVLVIVILYMGIKYLTSGPDAQAKLKVQLIGIVGSACVIFGAYTIWSTVIDLFGNM